MFNNPSTVVVVSLDLVFVFVYFKAGGIVHKTPLSVENLPIISLTSETDFAKEQHTLRALSLIKASKKITFEDDVSSCCSTHI